VRRACARDFGCGWPFLAGCSVNRQDDDRHTPRTEHVQQIKPLSCCGGTASQLAISELGAWVYTTPSEIIRQATRSPDRNLGRCAYIEPTVAARPTSGTH
jgi:hypothetical protein